MKRIIFLVISSCFSATIYSQNVGVGQLNPQMKLHVTKNDSALALFENTQVLGNNVKTSIFFKTGAWYTGGFATIGTGINTARLALFGYAETDPSNLKEYVSVLDNGNVGIGTKTPSSLLDVNGDINVSGTIKAQGVAGTPGQVLRTDNVGELTWSTISESSQYPNFVSFLSNTNWTVPAGVTRILIEAWGAGAGGYTNCGGGGGGYIIAVATVTPGEILPIAVGIAGVGGSSATDGGPSAVTIGGGVVQAFGGYAAPGTIGLGGNYIVTSSPATVIGYDGEQGRDGAALGLFASGYNGSAVMLQSYGGHGGDAGNTTNTGGISGIASGITSNYTLYSIGTTVQKARGPGGGGCINGTNTTPTSFNRGANGKVVIRY